MRVEFFRAHPRVHHALKLLQDVGLGYLTLGQQSPTLSGGEAQRIKLVTELAKVRGDGAIAIAARRSRNTRYTCWTSPRSACTWRTWRSSSTCCIAWSTPATRVVVVEHNLDVMAEADWIIDMGPEAGERGGQVVAEGTPAAIARKKATSHTGRVLHEFLRERTRRIAAA